jgi:hypothetical protein
MTAQDAALGLQNHECLGTSGTSGEAATHDSLGRSPRNRQKKELALKARDKIELVPHIPFVIGRSVAFEK